MSDKLKGLKQWLHAGNDAQHAEQLEELWAATSSYKRRTLPNPETAFVEFSKKQTIGKTSGNDGVLRRMTMLRAAAAVLVLIVAGFLLKSVFFAPDVAMFTVATDAQTTKVFSLPDGSVISLNRNSQLIYPEKFSGDIRTVQLIGEGFFEVSADKAHPFIVETQAGKVRVLGTKFNVRAFPDEESLEVFVKEGRVAVIPADGKSYELDPGAFLQYDQASARIGLTRKSSDNDLAWKTGKLSFQNAPVSEVVKAVERLYGVKATIEHEDLANCPVYFNVSVGKLQDVWNVLETTCEGVDVEITGQESFLIHGHCCQ